MSYILILYFMGTHVGYDLPSREACADNAAKLAHVINRQVTGKAYSNFSYSHHCLQQTPAMVELATRMVPR